jgi:bifunctional damage-control phosphatase, subfamily II, fusion protein
VQEVPDEAFIYRADRAVRREFIGRDKEVFPYLLVNVGSGVSIVRVDSREHFQRVGGTSLGGGTFWGLASLISNADVRPCSLCVPSSHHHKQCGQGFDEALELARRGKSSNVDMLVSDIYGGGYDKIGLRGDVIASSFGKAARPSGSPVGDFRDEDKLKALLHMISNNIGQVRSCFVRRTLRC